MFIDLHKLPEKIREELTNFLKENVAVNFVFDLNGEATGLPMIKVGSSVIPSEPSVVHYNTHGFAYPEPGPVQIRMSYRTTLHSTAAEGFLGGFPRYSIASADDELFVKNVKETLECGEWGNLATMEGWEGYDRIWITGSLGERIPEGAWYIMSKEGLSLAFKSKKMTMSFHLGRRCGSRVHRDLPKRGLVEKAESKPSFEVSFMAKGRGRQDCGYSQRAYLAGKWMDVIANAETDGEGLLEIAKIFMDNIEGLTTGEDLDSFQLLRKEFDAADIRGLITDSSLFVASDDSKLLLTLIRCHGESDEFSF